MSGAFGGTRAALGALDALGATRVAVVEGAVFAPVQPESHVSAQIQPNLRTAE